MDEKEFAKIYFTEIKVKGDEIESKYCLFCGGGQHQDQFTFSINTKKHTFNCLRGKCGEHGTFKELCDKYNLEADYMKEFLKNNNRYIKPSQEYIKPKYVITELNLNVINYFYGRGISEKTLIKAGVKSYGSNAVFQFFEKDKLVMNKIRLARKPVIKNGKMEMKEWKEAGGKHILWNMKQIDTSKVVILTEGMIDSLSCLEAGETNIVSIPSGTNDLTWIENSYDFIESVKEWILYVDNDLAGDKLAAELMLRFKPFKTRIVKHELKDANEELVTFGSRYIRDVIAKAAYPKVEGIENLANVAIVDTAKMERIPTGITIIDKFAGGYIFPSLNIWTGERGSGKSTVLSQTLLTCIEKDYKVFIYSGELMSGFFKLWLYSQAAGDSNMIENIDKETHVTSYVPDKKTIEKIDKWIDGKVYIYTDTNTNEEDKIFGLMEEAYKRFNCRIFVIDNLMTVKFNYNKDIYRAQSIFVDKLRLFIKNNNLILNLVVHPNKTGEVISGAGDIRNSAFNEFWIKKVKDDDTTFSNYDSTITISKNRYYGFTDVERGYQFSKKSKRLYEKFEDERTFGWNKKDLIPTYEQIPFI
jgi:twinkle protein